MAPALRPTNFNTSRLVQLLTQLTGMDTTQQDAAIAERLGQWLAFTDAIEVYAAHKAVPGPAGDTDATAYASLRAEYEQFRRNAVAAIVKCCAPGANNTRIRLPTPVETADVNAAIDYESYRRFYLAVQREMEAGLPALRARARLASGAASSAARQLAALDAVFESVFRQRETRLLASIPQLLQRRFDALRQRHLQQLALLDKPDEIAHGLKPDQWLGRFVSELQAVLLAELDLRLLPVLGLIETLSNEVASIHE